MVRNALGRALTSGHQGLIRWPGLFTRLPGEGQSNTAIARTLVISEAAVAKHIGNIFAKLRLPQTDGTNRRVLAVLAYLRGDDQPRGLAD